MEEDLTKMNNSDLTNKLFSAFAESSDIYRHLYLYEASAQVKAAAEQCIEEYRNAHPNSSVCRFTGASFVDAVIQTCAGFVARFIHANSSFITLLSQCNMLVIEGIEDLAGKQASMEKLYIILDKRLELGLPFLITGNTTPSAIPDLAPRIAAILDGSLIWELS